MKSVCEKERKKVLDKKDKFKQWFDANIQELKRCGEKLTNELHHCVKTDYTIEEVQERTAKRITLWKTAGALDRLKKGYRHLFDKPWTENV